jgi:hypothetical protein
MITSTMALAGPDGGIVLATVLGFVSTPAS